MLPREIILETVHEILQKGRAGNLDVLRENQPGVGVFRPTGCIEVQSPAQVTVVLRDEHRIQPGEVSLAAGLNGLFACAGFPAFLPAFLKLRILWMCCVYSHMRKFFKATENIPGGAAAVDKPGNRRQTYDMQEKPFQKARQRGLARIAELRKAAEPLLGSGEVCMLLRISSET
jgi:hypothetical protein